MRTTLFIFQVVGLSLGLALDFSLEIATAGTASTSEIYTYWKGMSPENIAIVEVDGFRVNEKCATSKKTCKALKAFKLERSKAVIKDPALKGHPASDHCERIGGNVHILTDSKLNQRNFCEFSDGTLVDSWDLLEAYKTASQKKGAGQ